jgi:hypothetical protein
MALSLGGLTRLMETIYLPVAKGKAGSERLGLTMYVTRRHGSTSKPSAMPTLSPITTKI